jgi:HSP20 family molecular chaperone IbpA
MAVNMPAVSVDPVTGRRRVDLLLDLGPPYTADDVVVKVDNGQRLIIEARHEERQNKGHVSTSSMQKQFDLGEDVDSATVKAMMRADGKLSVTAFVRQ